MFHLLLNMDNFNHNLKRTKVFVKYPKLKFIISYDSSEPATLFRAFETLITSKDHVPTNIVGARYMSSLGYASTNPIKTSNNSLYNLPKMSWRMVLAREY